MSDALSPDYYQRATLLGAQMEAYDVVEGWELTYHVGTAVVYLLRAGKKTPDAREDIAKAIEHLQRELLRLEASK
jgi:hypothetical protein